MKNIQKNLEEIKKIFLAEDIEDADKQDNLDKVRAWESDLYRSEAILSWQEHDITKEVLAQIKSAYKENSIVLSRNRALTQQERDSIWAKQDACIFMLGLMGKDARSQISQIEKEIEYALSQV